MPRSRGLLQQLLTGHAPEADAIAALVRAFRARREVEGQWFEVKAGLFMKNRQSDELRAAVCGFANAEGGFLLIGYDETAQAFDGVMPVGKQAPEQWAADALASIAARIPPPQYSAVEIEGKQVLLVAVDRARQLVYVIENGETAYYIRFGHQTLRVPDSHVVDLLLGRRARPEFVVSAGLATVRSSQRRTGHPDVGVATLSINVQIENDALVVGRNTMVGLVGWTANETTFPGIPSALLRGVDASSPMPYGQLGWQLFHRPRTTEPADVRPFQRAQAVGLEWRVPHFMDRCRTAPNAGAALPPAERAVARGRVEMKAALYVLAEDAEPSWHQLTFRYDSRLTATALEWVGRNCFRLEPCPYARPRVAVRFLQDDEKTELE